MTDGDTIAMVSFRHQLRLLVLSVAIVTLNTQPVFLLGAGFFQIGPEFGIGPLDLGFLTAAFFLTSSVSSVFLGRWVQRVGWRRAMRVNAVASGLLMLTIAGVARSPWVFAVLLVVAAAVYGMANPAANLSLAIHTDPRRAGSVFGLKHAGIPSSTLLAGFAVPVVVVGTGWRVAFVLSSVLAVLVLFLIPRSEPLAPERFAAATPRGRPIDRRGMTGLTLAAALGAVAATALGTYLVSAAVDVGFSESGAGILQFVGSAASIAMRIAAGVFVDIRRAAGYGGLIALMGVGAMTFAGLAGAVDGLFVLLVIVAYMSGWGWPGLMTYTVVDANRASAASSSALVQAGVFVGAGGGPLAIGAVIEEWGYDAAWWLVAASLGIGTVILVWTYRRAYVVGGAASPDPVR